MLNETRYQDHRIHAGWPNLPGEDAPAPKTAIIARKQLSPSGADDIFAIAHDDIHDANRIMRLVELPGEVVSRVRSLALIKIRGYIDDADSRLEAARSEGLDGLRIVGVLPHA
jgi:hypothetical protein